MPQADPPLSGIRVVDLSRVLAGPYATMTLADLGADVTKVEHPRGGDETRSWGPPFVGGEAAYFLSVNRSKRSVALDLKDPEGCALALELCARADVVIWSAGSSVADDPACSPRTLHEKFPGLVVVALSPFGFDGPWRDRPSTDRATSNFTRETLLMPAGRSVNSTSTAFANRV